ncbi:hypothetical protein [Lentzea waywayandensis]|uniref:hypothetical protein n=1 Tax=Lentzea waywayandensis TaxID=84724 RepID=UPI001FE9AABB|nr:hypothetical protein [Lentzea waywayandensis]
MSDQVVPLPQDLVLLPLSAVPGPRQLAEWSLRGPVAFVDAEFFGGTGSQRAQVWDQGRSVLGPLVREEDDPMPGVTPISQALRRLGVVKGEHHDEFDAVGLGRHRDTEDWVTSAE